MGGHRVLVVDDNPAIRMPLVALLEAQGFSARGVRNGREALRTLREGYQACLILLDLTMPIMDGWKFRAAQQQDDELASIPVAPRRRRRSSAPSLASRSRWIPPRSYDVCRSTAPGITRGVASRVERPFRGTADGASPNRA